MSKMTGDWKVLKAKLNDISSGKIKEDMEEQLQSSAKEIQQSIQQYITGQQGNWAPLDKSTIENKGSTKILIETGELVDSINVKSLNEDEYVISATGERNQAVLKYHEFGTTDMPSRPVIRPVFEEQKDKVKGDCKEAFIASLKK